YQSFAISWLFIISLHVALPILKIGDVITVHTGDIGTSAVVGKREEGSIGFATINTRPDKSVLDSDYLSTYFNTTVHKHWAIKMSDRKSTRLNSSHVSISYAVFC